MKKIIPALAISFLLFSSSVPVFAQGNPGGGGGSGNPPITVKLDNPFNVGSNLFDIAKALINNVVIPIGGSLCVLAFIWAGFQFVTAQGKSAALTNAKKTLGYAALGTVLILGAWMIADVIQQTISNVLS